MTVDYQHNSGKQGKGVRQMTLNAKKLVVLLVIAVIVIEARIWDVAHWLDRVGIVAWARHVEHVYLTGTALTVILVMVYLLGSKETS